MICIRKNRRGFTLVEMVLSLAIISIIFGLTTTLVVCVRNSFMSTYNLNDSSDYAVLYGSGFENSILSHTQNRVSGKWYISNNILTCSGTPVFVPDHLQTRQKDSETIVDKWNIAMYFNYTESSSRVRYIVCVTDNYYNPGKLIYTYSSMVWLPHFADTKLATPQGAIKVSDIQTGVLDPEDSEHKTKLTDYGTTIEYTAP
ncbi:MAG: prepilin-type N-terminal cleavage/methylation domain-containing protein [Saccharofermentans sp.]|jgi:prepilin-type N-terminal cleavage/methylation domain-containing protein|nr:prepilin-type N-terminal cleavage/methylation domain-containing protein [Mageeibacillus sp.]MCI1263953.1 prepilin-type N-terminal cleavage/methylation domain-containing protein [Saccharofermentans sp.]MCI1275606.1 prepilin-type N-terminal cleavage/methylation domain-containing protein [Saccharofermentans sp.]